MNWIEVYMNNPSVKRAVGASPNVDFASCNMDVNQAFFGQGDGMHNSAKLLPELIDEDIKLLVYAGNADAMCNFIVSTAFFLCLFFYLRGYMLTLNCCLLDRATKPGWRSSSTSSTPSS